MRGSSSVLHEVWSGALEHHDVAASTINRRLWLMQHQPTTVGPAHPMYDMGRVVTLHCARMPCTNVVAASEFGPDVVRSRD